MMETFCNGNLTTPNLTMVARSWSTSETSDSEEEEYLDTSDPEEEGGYSDTSDPEEEGEYSDTSHPEEERDYSYTSDPEEEGEDSWGISIEKGRWDGDLNTTIGNIFAEEVLCQPNFIISNAYSNIFALNS